MAPKKNPAKTEAFPKKPKGRPPKSQEKPKLKTPTILKIKLPLRNLTRTVQNVQSPNSSLLNKRPKDLTSNDKLELTNAVARAQLNKSDPVVFSPQPEPGKEVKIVKRRGKKKKVEEDNNLLDASISHESVSAETVCNDMEVARAQLFKSEPVVFSAQPEPGKVVKVVKRRGKKKKVEENNLLDASISQEPVSAETICNNTEEVNLQSPKTKKIRKTPATKEKKMVGQLGVNQMTKTARVPLKRKLVNAKDGNKNPPKKRWMQSKITEMKILVRRTSKASSNSENARTVTLVKPKIVRRRGRSKKNAQKLIEPDLELPTQSVHEIDCTIKKEDDDKNSKNANAIDSRKTSINSELSWTKDISDSSNTTSMTAVTSSDFVLIDRKLPEINLTKIDTLAKYKQVFNCDDCKPKIPDIMPKTPDMVPTTPEFSPKTPSDSSSSSSDSDSSDSESSSIKDIDIGSRHSLNLSVSSESRRSPIITQKNININTMNSNVTKISKALDKLSMSLKKIDLEIINWVGYQNEDININQKKVNEKIFQNLKEESNIIVQCRHINKLLADDKEITNNEANVTENEQNKIEKPFVKPTDVVVPKALNKTIDSTNFDKGNHSGDQFDYNDSKYELNDRFASNSSLYTSFDQGNDDEDALSLYAESIGFESHRNSVSSPPLFNQEIEEYIPQPVAGNVPTTNTIVYNPTKINNAQIPTETNQNMRPVAAVCEKQNADSTSVFREMSQDVVDRIEGIEKLSEPTVVKKVDSNTKAGPSLLATIFKPVPAVKSVVFKGMCFFNLIGSCKNQSRCRFPHVDASQIDVTSKLVRLSEDFFIQEYMLLKAWPMLRRKFGICFVEECKRRDLTRLLVEMAIDFVIKANQNSSEDTALKVYVLEEVLLYLNNIDLKSYEDLLKYAIQGKELCYFFLETIANSQNFSRFKPVFIKLTEFVIEHNKPVSLKVASHILERVAILPFKDSLAWAVINIIKRTEAVIFENSMMGQFEKQLCANEGLQREFLSVKEGAGVNLPTPGPSYPGGRVLRQDVDRAITSPLYPDGVQRYTSPDTTNLDSLNKPPEEPAITRSIKFDRTFPNYSSSSSEGTEEYPRTPKPNSLFSSWKHKTIYNKFSPQKFSHQRRKRQVTYGCSPPNFPRRQGPNFF